MTNQGTTEKGGLSVDLKRNLKSLASSRVDVDCIGRGRGVFHSYGFVHMSASHVVRPPWLLRLSRVCGCAARPRSLCARNSSCTGPRHSEGVLSLAAPCVMRYSTIIQALYGYAMKDFAEVLARSTAAEGWMSPHAAGLFHFLLAHQPAAERNILEIGVFKGKSAVIFAHEAIKRDETLVLMDIYIQPEVEAVRQLHPKIEVIEADSFNLLKTAAAVDAAPFRFIHVDGYHGYSHVMDDIKNSAKLVSRYGIICLDDFLNPAWPEVTVATFDFLAGREHDLVLFLAGFNKGFLCRSVALQSYCELIEGPLAAAMQELGLASVIKKREQKVPFYFYGIWKAET